MSTEQVALFFSTQAPASIAPQCATIEQNTVTARIVRRAKRPRRKPSMTQTPAERDLCSFATP
jgi:hypothetical protein